MEKNGKKTTEINLFSSVLTYYGFTTSSTRITITYSPCASMAHFFFSFGSFLLRFFFSFQFLIFWSRFVSKVLLTPAILIQNILKMLYIEPVYTDLSPLQDLYICKTATHCCLCCLYCNIYESNKKEIPMNSSGNQQL